MPSALQEPDGVGDLDEEVQLDDGDQQQQHQDEGHGRSVPAAASSQGPSAERAALASRRGERRPAVRLRRRGAPAGPRRSTRWPASLAGSGLPHPLLVDIAREAIAAGDVGSAAAPRRASCAAPCSSRSSTPPACCSTPTSAGRLSPWSQPAAATNLELDLATGERGSRHVHCGRLLARLCGAERRHRRQQQRRRRAARPRRAGPRARGPGQPGRERGDRRRLPGAGGDGAVGRACWSTSAPPTGPAGRTTSGRWPAPAPTWP